MRKYIILVLLVAAAVLVGQAATAEKPDQSRVLVQVNPSQGRAVVKIPAKAVEVTPGVFSLGSVEQNGEIIEGYAFVNYRKGYGKPVTDCGNGICEPGENIKKCPQDCGGTEPPEPDNSCYGFLAKGAKWKEVEPYMIDPTNTRGLDETFVRENMALDITKWEEAAGEDIAGDEIAGVVDGADTVSPDGKNEAYFGTISDPGAIAVTIIWGVFGGPPKNRRLIEWDQVYDETDFDWSQSGESGKMDFESIATHELGHSLGLADLYTAECSEQTMYGYAGLGETKKRTLETGDITGIKALYK